MTRNDAQIAREWAEKVSVREKITFGVDDETLAVARHILATTTLPTMADVEWDNDVHAGLCAESTDGGVVRMIGRDWSNDHADHILCYLQPWGFDSLPMCSLIPLPGTRLDLAPRRESVPETTPDHPTELTIEADYGNAPAGTVVATEGEEVWTKSKDGLWETFGILSGYNNYLMADGPRQVLRWGWEA